MSSNAALTSGEHISYWVSSVTPLAFSSLDKNIETDVLIIGGGIAGLTAAYCLAKEGRKVTLVEDGYIGSGETGRTTAHLTNALDDRYYHLEKYFGEDNARKAAESHTAAINWIEKAVKEENIDCHFRRLDGYLFLHPSDDKDRLEKELDATHKAGLHTHLSNTIPGISAEDGKCLVFPQQGQFHIMLYLQGLARAIISKGGEIYTRSRAENITEQGAKANGFEIKAKHIIVATNTPINDWVTMHTKQFPYRTYVIGATIPKGQLTPALWWDTGDHDTKWVVEPYHYVRTEPYNDEYDLLIAGGEDHKTGQADDEGIPEEDRYQKLIEWTKAHFPAIDKIVYKWSGQVIEPLDSLAFIGKNPGSENTYIITGDSGNGMTHGTLGGIIICDLINGRENSWASLYDPSRIPLKAAWDFLHEIVNMAAQYGDWLFENELKNIAELPNNKGAIINAGPKKAAIYRDETGALHSFSAVCPHLGCIVQWNDDEKSFDCPCHGSRFTKEGEIINGPAISGLKKIDIKEE